MPLAWKTLGRAWQVGAVIVQYSDDPVICRWVPETAMRAADGAAAPVAGEDVRGGAREIRTLSSTSG